MYKIITNIAWLFLERVVSVLGTLFITIYTARYLGPEKIGVINYSLALIAIIVPLSQLGSDTIVFNRTAKNYRSGVNLLLYSIRPRICVYLGLSIVLILYCVYLGFDFYSLSIVFLMIISSFFTSQDVYKIHYDSILESKVNSISSQLALIISLTLRLILVKISAGLIYFTLPYIINTLIPYMIKFFLFKKKASRIKKISARNRLKYQNYILCTGAPLALAALSVVIYTRVGEIMLGSMAGVATVAIYSSASSLASGWAIIPLIFMTSLLPKVIADKSTREKGFSFIHLLCLFIAGPLAAFFYCYSDIIILKTYGNEFLKASEILPLLSISSIFVVIGVISAKAIANKGGYKYLMIKTIVMSIFNVVLTFFLIKKYNIQGAAYSLLITEILSSTIANYFFQTKYVLNIHINIIYSYSYIFRIIKPKIKG